ncbi:aldehyde dehydrogenase family protein [Micromonospora ureilytica]|uniref:aldehyde dehydrogenase family protein n=1 Tax=Micromonospora ureilytica TaxID=709868 RepID=UPI002E151B08|nr:aldehyde dehydrogenase family protein [Micromonospora ureilytica]
MTLLDATTWQGTLHSNGWAEPAGGLAPVRSPATGEEIGQVGVANAEDVTRACERAATAQRAWAATGYAERAAVLRRAGHLFERHAAEIGDWIVRESGSIPPKAVVETDTAAQECYIDERQRDKIHALVTASVDAGARLAAGGTYEGLFYRPTVLTDVTPATPAYAQEIFGPVAPVITFADQDEAVELARQTEYGLSLGILSGDVMRAMALADRIPSGIVHINDQTVSDEAVAPFGGVGASGTGSRFGGPAANVDAFTETQWLTVRGAITRYPF